MNALKQRIKAAAKLKGMKLRQVAAEMYPGHKYPEMALFYLCKKGSYKPAEVKYLREKLGIDVIYTVINQKK